MIATMLADIAEVGRRELIQKRIHSGVARKARGKRLGRQPGQRLRSDHLAPEVMALVEYERRYRLVGLSKAIVADIVQRDRAKVALP